MTTLYGIKNCDTIKKAQKWLTSNDIEFSFHDYRKDGIDLAWIEKILSELDWEVVLNKRGTTYRQLSDDVKANLNKDNVAQLLLEHPAMIKRPILISGSNYHIGFKAEQYQVIFNK